tara:strand:+ start:433 stop:720 length:288 start_codon:yes stop_codon:yes gene_type:complete
MRILHLTLKKQWFDMIVYGGKRQEYREIKPYWDKRFNKQYDAVFFKNGYQKDAPSALVELVEIRKGQGISIWGAPNEKVYILELGRILERSLNAN